MPGDFIQEVHIFQCGQGTDGGSIMCSEIGWAKVPFTVKASLEAPDVSQVGWRGPHDAGIHISLKRLADVMRSVGVRVDLDEEAISRQLGPPPESP